MFANIPQRLTAPFGLLGDEAKLAFRSQPGGIAKLASSRNISESDSYWNQYFVLFDTASDVFSLISPNDIRRALLDAPENVATLLRVVTSRLFNLLLDHTFPTPTNSSVASYASSLIKTGTGSTERNTTKEVLNCLRILQRVLPVIFEVEGESNVFELEVLWKKHEAPHDPEETDTEQSPQFVIEDEDDSEDEQGGRATKTTPSKSKGKKQLPSLAERLFSSLIDLMFCCGFTIPTKLQVDHHKFNYTIWEKGVGSTTNPGPNHAYDANKTEVLRLLLVLLSRQIYVPASSLLSKPSLYTLYLTQKIPRRDVLTILCSLLNTAINSGQVENITIGNMAGKLPYNHLVFKGESPRSLLVGTCFQVLCLLLDFQSGGARDIVSGNGENQTSAPTARTNAFRYFLMKLHRTQDFTFIIDGVVGIFEQQMATMNNLLPGARKSLPHIVETVIFFWKMIELNKKFRAYVLESERATDILAYLLCHTLEIKDKPQQHGLCRALSYIVQTLSAEPALGVKLASPLKTQVPAKWHSGGSLGDFLINSVYSIVATTSGTLTSVYPALIIALSNCAPYFKHLSVVSSNRLLQLFASFSNPMFLLSDEGHPRLLFFMLEIFNSIILHNASDNPNLMYGILSAHKSFEDLGTFTLSRGLREVRRIQLSKEEQARKAEGNPKSRHAEEEQGPGEEPQDEKARLLESENGGFVDLERGRISAENIIEPPPQSSLSDSEQGISGIQSPTTEEPPTPGRAKTMSEKARGKMKERRSMSLETNSSLDRIAAAGIGRNGFVPTQEWVTSWQQGLPLDSVMLVVSELLPKIQEMQTIRHKASTASGVVDFLSRINLKHVLPPAPPLTPRRFLWTDASIVWLTSLIWGEVYVRGMSPLGIWNSTNVRLFYVKHAQVQPRQLTETVSNVVGGFLGRSTSSDGLSPSRTRAERG